MASLLSKNWTPRSTGSLRHILSKVFCATLKTAPVSVYPSTCLFPLLKRELKRERTQEKIQGELKRDVKGGIIRDEERDQERNEDRIQLESELKGGLKRELWRELQREFYREEEELKGIPLWVKEVGAMPCRGLFF